MELKEQIKSIVDEIRPQFQVLGNYGFNEVGNLDEVVSSFVDVYEGYTKAKELYVEKCGELPQRECCCQFSVEDVDESELKAAYSIAKAQGFLPPPIMERIFDFTMHMNSFFLTAQEDNH